MGAKDAILSNFIFYTNKNFIIIRKYDSRVSFEGLPGLEIFDLETILASTSKNSNCFLGS